MLVLALAPMAARAQEQSAVRQPGGLMDASAEQRPMQMSAYIIVPYAYGFGIGGAGRFAIPIVHDGFITKLNDSVEIELGADIWYSTWWFYGFGFLSLGIPVEGRWTFHITPTFSAYGKVGIGLGMGFAPSPVNTYFFPYLNGGIGALYKLGEGFYLRGELSNGLRIGVGIDI
jgi:hypothetical protein